MIKKPPHLDKLPMAKRLFCLAQSILLLVGCLMVLIYGTILTTNLLTQLNHAQTWVYALVFISSLVAILTICILLFSQVVKRMVWATTGINVAK